MKKLLSIFPYLFAAILVSLTWHLFFSHWSFSDFYKAAALAAGEFLQLQMFGFSPIFCATGVAWYLSATLIAKVLLYPIVYFYISKGQKAFVSIISIATLFLYGYLSHEHPAMTPGEWIGITYVGTLRGLAGISLGIICFEFCAFLEKLNFNLIGRLIISCIEVACYAGCILCMKFCKNTIWNFHIIFLLFVAISISLSELSFMSYVNKFKCSFLKKASISIYLSHFYIVQNFENLYPNLSNKKAIFLIIGQICICSLATYTLANFIKTNVRALLLKLRIV